jgi:hypothetical protein
MPEPTCRASGTFTGQPTSPFSSFTSSSIAFSPSFFIATYWSSLPGRPARAIVTWTPRTSFGSGRGCRPVVCGLGTERADARTGLCLSMWVAITPPMTPATISARSAPEILRRCLWRRCRASARRTW